MGFNSFSIHCEIGIGDYHDLGSDGAEEEERGDGGKKRKFEGEGPHGGEWGGVEVAKHL